MQGSRARIAIVGVGAIGGSMAADLSDLDRHEVHLCLRTKLDELCVHHSAGESRIRERLHSEATAIQSGAPFDWVLLATKAHQSEAARPWLQALCSANTVVAVLQNGVDHVERITALVPEGTEVLPVVVRLPAEKTAPGEVRQERDGGLAVPEGDAGRRFAALFEGARTDVRTTPDFATQAWWKLMSNAAIGGVCALTLRSNGVGRDEPARGLILALMREVAAVGRAEGARLPDDAPQKTLDAMLAAAGEHWTSIAVDRREGRPMEWRARNEVVGRLGRKHGVDTPLNDAITALLCAADVSSEGDA